MTATTQFVFLTDGKPGVTAPLLDVDIRYQPHAGEPELAVQIGARVIRMKGELVRTIETELALYRTDGLQSAYLRGLVTMLSQAPMKKDEAK